MITRRTRVSRAIVLVGCLLTAVVAVNDASAADETSGVSEADLAGHLDLSVPQSPAFTALGVTPQSVVQSDDWRTVSAGLLKGVDPRGNLQAGLAVDVRPYLLIYGRNTTLSEYRSDPWVKYLSRIQASFATTSGSSDADKADRQAVGLNMKLWMEADPAEGRGSLTKYYDADGNPQSGTLDDCYRSYLAAAAKAPAVLPDISNGSSASESADELKIAAAARKAIAACLDPYKTEHWNAGSAELAVAGTHASGEQQNRSGTAVWLGVAHSLGSAGQAIFQVQRYNNRLLPVKNQTEQSLQAVNETDAGLRLRAGSSRGTVMVEGMWTDSRTGGAHDRYWRGSVGTELMIFKDAWVEFTVGKAFGTTLFANDTTYSGQVKFGFSDKSLISSAK